MTPKLLLLGALALTLSCASNESRSATRPPNVILVLTDDQGYGDLSCHGNPVLKTPALDRLHAESIRLTDFHVAPMCTPTRGQILTGRDALANGAMNVSSGRTLLRRGIPTMADLFAAGGYRTGQFGKWHLGENYPYRPHDRGFQEAVYFPSSHISSAADYWENDYFDDHYRHNGEWQAYKGYCTDVFFREAKAWMKDCAERGQPFFTYLPLNAPHGPLYVPQKYREPYKSQPPNIASFFGMIANIDENMAGLDEFLAKSGLRDNTILIFMTDNGGTVGVPVYNAGMRGKKIELYEGGHRVPCFIRWPAGRLRAPGDAAELTQCQDLLPTLLDLCGLSAPKEATFDGVSLAKLLRGEVERLPDRMLVTQFSRMDRPEPAKGDGAVLWQRWRLIQGKELYDLRTDPAQKTNVIEQHPDVAAKMNAHYDGWWSRVGPHVNEFGRITVGADAERSSLLSACDWQDVFLDQSKQVRAGEVKIGASNLLVERDGEYEIELRRWPVEANAPIAAGLPPYQGADGVLPAGKALPIVKARIRISDVDDVRPVSANDASVVFSVPLKAGPAQLQTWFLDGEGKALCGAYYVYLRRK
ncbi:MAG TPA: arylsulfatase [Planctomycetota bacterium]|jgi:arylsulfatase|nr:arylsulfatase [Planctomycetota bacterium]